MSGKYVEIDTTGLEQLVDSLNKASKDFKREFAEFLDATGVNMLEIIQDEIIRVDAVDTRLLLNSFTKGASGNIYKLNSGDLTLEIGTNVEYASYVNDGHKLNPEGVNMRFIPGYKTMKNGKEYFVYQKGCKSGIMLKQKFIPGKHYMEHAVDIMEKMFPKYVESKLEEWLNDCLGG